MSFLAAGIAGGVAIAGTVASSAIQASAAKKAAKTQAQGADEALQLQREMYEQQRQDIAPWRQTGEWALPQLREMIRQGPGAPFNAPAGLDPSRFAFTAPTADTLQLDPGFQFRLKTGMQALEGSAAVRGGLLSGGAMRGAMQLGQDLGSQEYGAAYGRALGENQLGYGRALTQNQDQYTRALQEWQLRHGLNTEQYNRLAGLSGTGQTATQYLGGLGSQYAQQAGENILGRANALSAGQAAVGQAWGSGIQDIAGTVGNMAMFYRMNQQQRPPTPSPQQAGYNPNSVPYDPWTFGFA